MNFKSHTGHDIEELSQTGIYAIVNTTSGKFYIGSASTAFSCPSKSGFYVRWSTHVSELNLNKHHCCKLQRAWNKYGPEAFKFQILEFVESEKCIKVEQTYLDLFPKGDREIVYNTCFIAGNTIGVKRSEEEKQKIREAQQKTYQFNDCNNNIVEVTNLCLYAKQNKLHQPSLWMLAVGIKKTYSGLKCVPEVYIAKQDKLKRDLEYKKQTEWLYSNLGFVKHLGKIKYRVYSKRKIFQSRAEALEYALICQQIGL
jgi:group I intron endonuclease